MSKNRSAIIGVEGFYYGVIDPATDKLAEDSKPTHVKFLQEISLTPTQEIEKAYGDNMVAEQTVNNGTLEVSGQFHKIPIEDKAVLFGYEQNESGLYGTGDNDTPPYIAVVFTATRADGGKEYFGLPKGMFTAPEIQASTKEESVEFSSETVTAEFISRHVDGFKNRRVYITGSDDKDETEKRDAIFQAIFNQAYKENEVEDLENL